ncbi:MAG: diguanylate cyclase [Pseudomonadota bacterium]|jgi:diguanylate cyclase (GGDEF)-like protein|nr:diguanylate cyclase [Pseudomonadota bacterium]
MSASATAPNTPIDASAEQVQVGVMHELCLRNRESTVLGLLPILLMVWAHLDIHPFTELLAWAGCMAVVQVVRFTLAHRYIRQPEAQAARLRRWYALEWLCVLGLALGWVVGTALLGTQVMDPLFYLRLIFVVGLMSFLLSSTGLAVRIYASVLAVLVAGTLTMLYLRHPEFPTQYPVVPVGLTAYGFMLLIRSRGEHRRTYEWVRARLNRQRLLAQLNASLAEERNIKEQLRQQSQELENRNRELSELAVRDGLTRAFRRGHIEAELRRLIKGLHRRHDNFCVLMMDIDFFKRVNDQYGHAVGDEVLRRLAAVSQTQLRETDLFGRWGGEEFIVLMPQTTLDEAIMAAQRLRQAIAAMVFDVEGTTFQITISIGAAQLQPMENADAVVARSDEALYAAKHAGRNCVMAAPALMAGE